MSLQKELNSLQEAMDSKFFKSLSEPVRLEILKLLMLTDESDVNGLAEKLPQDRSVISRHLNNMNEAGILKSRKEGRHLYYSINGKEIIQKFDLILKTIKKCVSLKCC